MEQIQRRKAERKPQMRGQHTAVRCAPVGGQPCRGGDHRNGSHSHDAAAQKADAPRKERAAHGGHDLRELFGAAHAQQLLYAADQYRAVAQALTADARGGVRRGGDSRRVAAPA